jgi:predicted amidophosphoribosyltransferase
MTSHDRHLEPDDVCERCGAPFRFARCPYCADERAERDADTKLSDPDFDRVTLRYRDEL